MLTEVSYQLRFFGILPRLLFSLFVKLHSIPSLTGWGCCGFSIPMASFQDFKYSAFSYVSVGIISWFGYQLNTLNGKVDKLIEVSAGTVVRIEGLEREVYKTSNVNRTLPPYKLPLQVRMTEVAAIINDNNLTPINDETFN